MDHEIELERLRKKLRFLEDRQIEYEEKLQRAILNLSHEMTDLKEELNAVKRQTGITQ